MKGRCVQCRKTLVKRVGVFCGHFYKERGPYPPCQTMWCGGWYVDQSKDGEREVESRYEAGRNSNHMNTYFQCNICHFRNIQVRSLERSNLKYKTLLETIRRKSLDTSWIREPGTILGNMWINEGEMRAVSEDTGKRSGGILRTFLQRARAIPSMSDNVVWRLVCRSVEGWGKGSGKSV